MKSSMFRLFGAGVIALAISACGGGGSDGGTSATSTATPPAASTGDGHHPTRSNWG